MKISRGFTLIELVLVIVITSIIAGISGTVLYIGFKSYFVAQELNPMSSKAEIAIRYLSNELKSAYDFTSINTTSMSFLKVDGTSVTYSLSGSVLSRSENGGASYPLTNQVSGLVFSYYDTSMAVTSSLTAVGAVTIQLTLQGSGSNITLINTVYCGNSRAMS